MKTTKEHHDEFALYIAEFQDLLNLRDWRIEPSGKPAQRGAMAQVATSLDDRLAVWSLGKDWGAMAITSKALRETACHEALHILLAPLVQAAASRDEEATAGIEHSVVVILEKLLSK